eukprot:snap_masked-scaffold922_size80897-processed-gene-0.4 protein:Tk09252 transcript:snap_masked-scaffold922_size80897-processed-gene-0.4-mRNA-1 annotation:"protein retroactive precursor"
MKLLLLGLLAWVNVSECRINRCFACRSRGQQGDCRDPFYLSANSTVVESKSAGVETPPCASGWCSKIMEGDDKNFKDADYGRATERDCLQRPPNDNKERCAQVLWKRKQVMMCFCKGDLCNEASQIATTFPILLGALALVAFVPTLL